MLLNEYFISKKWIYLRSKYQSLAKDFTIFSSLTVVTKFENHTKKEYTLHFTSKNDYYQYLMDIFTHIIILMSQTDEIWMLEIVE